MKLGMVGLGRMGSNMVRRLARGGHECAVFDVSAEKREALAKEGAAPAGSLEELARALPAPRAVWLMLPAGEATERTVAELAKVLSPGDAVIDGGNSRYGDDARRAALLAEKGLLYADVGVSGGIRGLERGYCLMIGCEPALFARLEPVFKTLAPEKGYLRCGGPGAGHFSKMVHNAIEYGLMQAYAEGLDLLRAQGLDPAANAEVWRRGSVISSWLLDLTAEALAEDPRLSRYEGVVSDSGEGRWALDAAVEKAVPVPALTAALFARFASRGQGLFADKVLSAMRAKFGGHAEPKGGR